MLKVTKLENGRFGYINEAGEKAFEADFKHAWTFRSCSNDLATVQFDNGNYGFITKSGEKAFETEYYFAGVFTNGYAQVTSLGEHKLFYINTKGEFVQDTPIIDFDTYSKDKIIDFKFETDVA